jgi:low affinity Fe/Cu permease
MPVSNFFTRISNWVSRKTGHPLAFVLAFLIILTWLITGPIFHFSDTWQLVINTATTIVTFLMVFLIQSTQNRDTTALQLKLDELIYVTKKAHNAMLDIEELSDKELESIRKNYKTIAAHAKSRLKIENVYSQRAKRAIKKH